MEPAAVRTRIAPRRKSLTGAPAHGGSSTVSSARAKRPSPPADSLLREDSVPGSWSPSINATSWTVSKRPTSQQGTMTALPAPGRSPSPALLPLPPHAGSPATQTPSPSCSAATAASWTSPAPPGLSRPTSGKPSPRATKAAPSPTAPSQLPGARPANINYWSHGSRVVSPTCVTQCTKTAKPTSCEYTLSPGLWVLPDDL